MVQVCPFETQIIVRRSPTELKLLLLRELSGLSLVCDVCFTIKLRMAALASPTVPFGPTLVSLFWKLRR